MKTAIVLLTWQRITNLKVMLASLNKQTYKDFEVFISNANLDKKKIIERYAFYANQAGRLKVHVSHDGNETLAFRRFKIGKELNKKGFDIILFIDDDVIIPHNYVKIMLDNYEPKTYASNFAWSFLDDGRDYYKKRIRRKDNKEKIHYCGTGVSMIDSSIFLNDGIHKAPKDFYPVEDLWLSYYAQHVLGWNLKYVEIPDVIIKGSDSVALWRQVAKSKKDKADLLKILVRDFDWKL